MLIAILLLIANATIAFTPLKKTNSSTDCTAKLTSIACVADDCVSGYDVHFDVYKNGRRVDKVVYKLYVIQYQSGYYSCRFIETETNKLYVSSDNSRTKEEVIRKFIIEKIGDGCGYTYN